MALKRRLLVGPTVSDQRTLESLVARLAHYLAHVDVERIVISVTTELAATAPRDFVTRTRLPRGIDPAVLDRVSSIAQKVVLHDSAASLVQVAADFLLLWDSRAHESEPWATIRRRFRENRTCFVVDWMRTRTDGIWFAEAALVMSKDSRVFDSTERDRFATRTAHLVGRSTSYLVATGPSARTALEIDMADGLRIMCNTAILDDELIDHVRPDIVTFADPIFHFGPSTYAQRFQRALGRVAQRHDFTVVTLERFAPLLRDRLPRLGDRVVGVRHGLPSWPQNYNLLHELAVRPYPNILTMLMLPLAATFSRAIELIGFDGRNPRESYFWQHGTTVQFGDELTEIRKVHPGFFEIDYADYYDQHLASVELMCVDIELRGGSVTPRSNSFMLPLRRRAARSSRSSRPAPLGPTIVSLTPDWASSFGHFGPWERTLANVARRLGYQYRSLASRGLLDPDESTLPTFTHGTLLRDVAFAEQFESELRAGLAEAVGGRSAIVCFYASDVWQLPAILKIGTERADTTFVVNLMRSHDEVSEAAHGRAPISIRLLRECLAVADNTNVHVCMDTDSIVDDLERATGRRVLTWPMIGLGDPTVLQHSGALPTERRPVQLVAPVHAHIVKGFPEVVELAERLSDSLLLGRIAMTARFVAQPTGSSSTYTVLVQRFRDAGGKIITDNLSDGDYALLVGRAHVVLLPYRRDRFRTRTSGVLLDAVAAGKPVVAVRGTWAGDLVEHFGLGVVYEDKDVDSFEQAVRTVIGDISAFTDGVVAQRDRILARYSPQRLISFLATLAAKRNPPPDGAAVAALIRYTDLAIETQLRSDTARDDSRITELAQIEDLRRSREDLNDRIELLRSVADWRQKEIHRLSGTSPVAPKPVVSNPRPAEPERPNTTTEPTGRTMSNQLSDHVYERVAGAHLDELALVAELVRPDERPGGVMIDVGAHRGSAFRRFHATGWTVHAFEPDPRHVAHLRKTFRDDARVILDTRAVSNVSGQRVAFYVSEESTGISGLSAFRDSHESIGEVETVALRDLENLDRVDLLKIDTEGYERFVLEGFPWDRLTPDVVVAEFEDHKTKPLGYTTADLIAYLHDRGYQVWASEWHPIVRYGIRHQWHRLVNSAFGTPGTESWGNLVALAKPVSSDAMGRALATVLTVDDQRQSATGSRSG